MATLLLIGLAVAALVLLHGMVTLVEAAVNIGRNLGRIAQAAEDHVYEPDDDDGDDGDDPEEDTVVDPADVEREWKAEEKRHQPPEPEVWD